MKKIINVVEDEKDLNELVKRYLEKEGYIVNSYLTFDEAYAHLDDEVDLWVLDIMLDDKSGFDLIEEIKSRDQNKPVIFMSARDKEFDRIIGLEKGSDDYITKPFSPKEMVLRVNNIIKRVYKEDARINVDGYLIDGEIICPYLDGIRKTINDVHYVISNGIEIPVGESEFAKDKTFGFKSRTWRILSHNASV